MIWFGGLVLTVFGFIFGRVFSQSEVILSEKRRVYVEFLKTCPTPNDAYDIATEESAAKRHREMNEVYGPLLLFAAPKVVFACGHYLSAFAEADLALSPDSPALDPAFTKAAKAHNDLILEMRRDALAWSAFGYYGESRLPADELEKAKRMGL